MNNKEELLIEQAQSIEEQYQKAFRTGVIDLDRVSFELEALNKYLNTRIWLIDRKGEVYINSRIEDISIIEKELKYDELKTVFNGGVVRREGYFKNFFDEPVLSIGYPIKINNQVVFALFMHAPIPEIDKTSKDIYRIVFMSLLFSTLIAIALVFYVSKNMTNQIRDLNSAVKIIAKGNFKKRLKTNRNDEIGELAVSVNEMAADLSQLDDMRRRFISNLSHDLRTPLTTINGFVNAILDGTIEENKEKKYLKIVAEESDRLTKLTNDILDLSKIESGELKLNKESFNINEVLINEIDKFEKRIANKNINVSVELSKDNPRVVADAIQIKRVIYNLVDNAVKFVNESGKIVIKTYTKHDKAHVVIENTGVDLSKEELSHIWERFNKLDTARSKDKTGSGLGLAIVKEIISSHGENIEVFSKKESGVKFIFSLSIEE